MKILLIEDEKLLVDTLQDLLTCKGFQADAVYDGDTGADYAMLGVYDLIILDVMMPGMNGFEVARKIRANQCHTPILMLTAKADVSDRIEGLNAGADYYLTKPFDTQELLACINALLRRQEGQVNILHFGNTELELSTAILRCGERTVRLTAKEFDVMRQLMRSGRNLIPKETLLARVWGYESNAMDNHVEVYMAFLRKKLQSIGSNLSIKVVRRMGYHLEVAGDD